MIRNPNSARRGGVLGTLLLALLLTLSACGGAASPTVAPTSTPVAPTAIVAVTATMTPTLAATPTAANSTGAASPTAVASATPSPAITPTVAPTATLAPTATVAPTAVPTIAPTVAPTVAAVPRVGQPVRIQIPVIKVDAAIEYVGLTPEGNMDTPKNYDNTAWYQPGPRPGDVGNAVIDGHVDSKTGIAVFWYLAKLKPGDEVFVVGDDGVTRRFVVDKLDSYGRTDAPLQQIFGPTAARHLNLITCDSTTPFADGHYAANVVVYTTYAP